MRPVNLIPKEERPGGRRPLREGPLAYILVGALALAVIGVTALVVTNTKVSERQTEVTQLQSEKANLQAKVTRWPPTPNSRTPANSAPRRWPNSPTAASTGIAPSTNSAC